MKLIFSKNFDDFDDYKEVDIGEDLSPYSIGKIINFEQQSGWMLDIDEYEVADRVYLLACKNEFIISAIQQSLDNLTDDITNIKNKL